MSSRDFILSRREWLKLSAAGAIGVPVSGWLDVLSARAAEQSPGKPRHKSCILLFMSGGPSHVDTFDPKPENETSAFRPIDTNVPGIQICETLPKTAHIMQDCVLLRGMSTTEGSHGRARYYLHTGYRQGVGGVVHPSLGAIASAKLGQTGDSLPNFVCVGGQTFGSGYAGPAHAPLEIAEAVRGVENLKPVDSLPSLDRRISLLEEVERGFLDRVQAPLAEAHLKTYQRAVGLMHSARAKAFDLNEERPATRARYGGTAFGDACLLARRLVENGVSFVEVPMGGWDTHNDNTSRVKNLCGTLDPALAGLITDLKERGLLETTLVVWMGEFGRTPFVGKKGGRDHYPRAWTTLLAGAGLKTGQIVGCTDKDGADVKERPISAIDFMATVCKALEINYTESFQTRGGRPIRIVEKGEKVVQQVFG